MIWILGTSKDIAVNGNEIQARRNYIQYVTKTVVTDWNFIKINGQVCKEFLCCTSDDDVHGTLITAHIQDVYKLCSMQEICNQKFVVANTCIWKKSAHKTLLNNMMSFNRSIELWFAKQELTVDSNRIFRQTTTLNNVGQFGFQTSLSERELFKNKSKGLMEAIKVSFNRISPILLTGD